MEDCLLLIPSNQWQLRKFKSTYSEYLFIYVIAYLGF